MAAKTGITVDPNKPLTLAQRIAEAKAAREAEQGKQKRAAKVAAVAQHPTAAKALGKVGREAPSPAQNRGKVGLPKPSRVKASPKPKKAVKAPTGSRKGDSTHCSICGKPLERPSSVSAGMGDICQHKIKMLPAGTTLEDHYANITEYEVPDGWIKLKDAITKAHSKGVSTYRFIQAIGGDRMIRKPINSHFKVVIVKNVRYIDNSCLQHLKDLEKI